MHTHFTSKKLPMLGSYQAAMKQAATQIPIGKAIHSKSTAHTNTLHTQEDAKHDIPLLNIS